MLVAARRAPVTERPRTLQFVAVSLFCLSVGFAPAGAPLPAPATPSVGIFAAQAEIGASAQPGAASFDAKTGEYRVTGGGVNIWAAADAFYFLYRPVTGDFTLSADVQLVGSGGNPHRKAVLMARQSLDPGSPYADVALHGVGLTSLQYRRSQGAATEEVQSPVNAPLHLRLERRGDQFTMMVSRDGATWTRSGPVTVVLGRVVDLGLGVCAHDAAAMQTAVFSHVVLRQ